MTSGGDDIDMGMWKGRGDNFVMRSYRSRRIRMLSRCVFCWTLGREINRYCSTLYFCFPVNIVICCHEYHSSSSSSSANEWGRGMCSGTFNVILHCIQCIFKFNKNFFECFIAYSNKIVEQIQKFSLIFTFPAKIFNSFPLYRLSCHLSHFIWR